MGWGHYFQHCFISVGNKSQKVWLWKLFTLNRMGDYFQHCSISVGKKSHLKPTDAEQDGGLFSTLFHNFCWQYVPREVSPKSYSHWTGWVTTFDSVPSPSATCPTCPFLFCPQPNTDPSSEIMNNIIALWSSSLQACVHTGLNFVVLYPATVFEIMNHMRQVNSCCLEE